MPLLQLQLNIFDLPASVDTLELLLGFVKFLLVAGGILYLLFAGLVIRQIQLMKATIESNFSNALLILSIANLVLAIVVLLYFLLL